MEGMRGCDAWSSNEEELDGFQGLYNIETQSAGELYMSSTLALALLKLKAKETSDHGTSLAFLSHISAFTSPAHRCHSRPSPLISAHNQSNAQDGILPSPLLRPFATPSSIPPAPSHAPLPAPGPSVGTSPGYGEFRTGLGRSSLSTGPKTACALTICSHSDLVTFPGLLIRFWNIRSKFDRLMPSWAYGAIASAISWDWIRSPVGLVGEPGGGEPLGVAVPVAEAWVAG